VQISCASQWKSEITHHRFQGYVPVFPVAVYIIMDPVTTYLLTPWSRVLLEKLTDSAASQEIPHIFGTRRFITVLTSARHLSLS